MRRDEIACEIRCPVHGFIGLSSWERRIVDHRAFQRLRRVRQLAWTDYVYPGATHTRFEHSLGVMHVATLLFDSIIANSGDFLREVFKYNDVGIERDRQKVRLAALLHDIGHAPFSHATERLMPVKREARPLLEEDEELFKHEDYSIALITGPLLEVIDDDKSNKRNGNIQSNEVAAIIQGSSAAGPALFWRELISGQLDADRMDYLLRDSHHAGVAYGRFDLARLVATICAYGSKGSQEDPKIGVYRGGAYAAEGLILARYSMHKQVYFHKTRIACNVHICDAVRKMLPNKTYPRPDTDSSLSEFLKWDDFRVMSLLTQNVGGEAGERLMTRNHYRLLLKSEETSNDLVTVKREADYFDRLVAELGQRVRYIHAPRNSWYSNESDIQIVSEEDRGEIHPLSEYSPLLRNINFGRQRSIYVDKTDVSFGKQLRREIETGIRSVSNGTEAQSMLAEDPASGDIIPRKGVASAS